MKYYLGLDIGTSSVKGVLLSEDGSDKRMAHKKFEYLYPGKARVEISAGDYIDTCMCALHSLSEQLPEGAEIAGICEASASGNLLLLDSDNKPLTNIINWQDNRVTDEISVILGSDFDVDDYYNITGWQLGKSFPLAQLCYIKHHTPELLDKAEKICMSTEYLNFILTGKWGIGTSAGTPFYLIDQQKSKYCKPIIDKLGISEDKLPPIVKTGSIVGEVTAQAAKLCGIANGTPVIAGTFDHPSAAIGAGVKEEGQLIISCGTSWVGFFPILNREKIIGNKLLCDPFLSPEGCWGAMFSIPSVSAAIDNYVKRYISQDENMYNMLDALAENAESGGLRINLCEMKDIIGYSKENIACAIFESLGNMLKERLDKFSANGITAKSVVMAGGFASSRPLVRMVEKLIGIPVTVYDGSYSGAVGAAKLAKKGMA